MIASSWRWYILNIHEMVQRITRCYLIQVKLKTNNQSELPSILNGKFQGNQWTSLQGNIIIVFIYHQRLNPQHVVFISWVFLCEYQDTSKKLDQMCCFCIDFVRVLMRFFQGIRIAQKWYISWNMYIWMSFDETQHVVCQCLIAMENGWLSYWVFGFMSVIWQIWDPNPTLTSFGRSLFWHDNAIL